MKQTDSMAREWLEDWQEPVAHRGWFRRLLFLAVASLAVALVAQIAVSSLGIATRGFGAKERTTFLGRGGDLQQTLELARPGDTIVLQAGAVYEGPITLPRKTGSAWVTIRSSGLANLPPAGQRIGPSHARYMARIIAPGSGEGALRTAPGAHHYRLVGLEFTKATDDAVVHDLVELGDGGEGQTSPDRIAHHLVLDRCYIHGLGETKRGISLQSGDTEIIGCYISDIKMKGQENQAICGWNGPGPYRILNNYIEASGINILFGGADPSIKNLVPSDITIRRNHIAKRPEWRGSYLVKNLFELKNARRVLLDGNLLEYNWVGADQGGYAIQLTPRNQEGTAPWSTVQDVTISNNIIRHAGGGIFMFGLDDNPSVLSERVRIANNLFEDLSGSWGGAGRFLTITETKSVTIEHNTVFAEGAMIWGWGDPAPNFVFRNNVITHGQYGVSGDDFGAVSDVLKTYFPGAIFRRNVIIGVDSAGAKPSDYPPGNFFPESLAAVGFIDASNGNYRLAPTSPYRGRATDGTDIGCNFPLLDAARR